MNSDGLPEKIYFFSKERHRGIQIENSETEELVTLGLSESIIPGNNLDWVEYWGITTDSSTYEITFNELNEVEGQRIVRLISPSIILRGREEGGGLITMKDGQYTWINQSD